MPSARDRAYAMRLQRAADVRAQRAMVEARAVGGRDDGGAALAVFVGLPFAGALLLALTAASSEPGKR
jgi:hypothetical protein